ncbi:hypothetical protein OPT61_g5372 [Boeremia exigua]|uniref:Uncharacterized protein n=1 Tax=Boeremia exigua TaxID=749465 RepID=A0ACC2IAR0_9PLEO|nr:hypothetical protein OPT61_g5372 [Boeremia exigua]
MRLWLRGSGIAGFTQFNSSQVRTLVRRLADRLVEPPRAQRDRLIEPSRAQHGRSVEPPGAQHGHLVEPSRVQYDRLVDPQQTQLGRPTQDAQHDREIDVDNTIQPWADPALDDEP